MRLKFSVALALDARASAVRGRRDEARTSFAFVSVSAASASMKLHTAALAREMPARSSDGKENRSSSRRADGEGAKPAASCKISVVIPALDEAARVRRAVESARACSSARVVVVDGGSKDDTARVARQAGARVLSSERGRGRQMNAGAVALRERNDDDVLVFLHADTVLPPGYGETIAREMLHRRDGKRREWGAFAFKMTAAGRVEGPMKTLAKRAIEFGTNVRCRLLGMPYGDQAFVIDRRAFEAVGGFDELPFMEDYVMAQKLRKRSAPVLFPDAVTTSGRRWDERGLAKVTIMNQVIILGYHLGVPVRQLAEWYRW